MLIFISATKLIAELALSAFVGQWVLGLVIGARQQHNFAYQILASLTHPFINLTRVMTPRSVDNRHMPLLAFGLVLGIWLGATLCKIWFCLQVGLTTCR